MAGDNVDATLRKGRSAVRQASYRARQKEQGRSELTLWVAEGQVEAFKSAANAALEGRCPVAAMAAALGMDLAWATESTALRGELEVTCADRDKAVAERDGAKREIALLKSAVGDEIGKERAAHDMTKQILTIVTKQHMIADQTIVRLQTEVASEAEARRAAEASRDAAQHALAASNHELRIMQKEIDRRQSQFDTKLRQVALARPASGGR